MRFATVVEQGGGTTPGLPVPDEVLRALEGGRRPAVRVTAGASAATVGPIAGRAVLPLSAEHRSAAGLAAGDEVEVDLVLDVLPREVALPDDLPHAWTPPPPPTRSSPPSPTRSSTACRRAPRGVGARVEAAGTRTARVRRAVERLSAGEQRHWA